MKGKGVFREHSHRRRSSGKKVKGTPSNVAVIDLDGDNVVIIDGTESSHQKFKSSSVVTGDGRFSFQGVINLDDDDDDPGICVDADGDLVSDASSTKSRYPAFKTMQTSVELDADECQVIPEKNSTFQFSKCKQTYRTKSSGRNCYGLDPYFDNGSTDSDFSDCELMEDSFGKIREQWERASLKRKHGAQNRHSGLEDQASASSSNVEARTNADVENDREQHIEVPVCSSSSNGDYRKESLSEFFESKGAYMEGTFKPQSESSFVGADQKVKQEGFSCRNPMSEKETESLRRNVDFQPGGGTVAEDPHCTFECQSDDDVFIPGFWNEEPSPQRSFQHWGGTVAEDPHCSDVSQDYEDVYDGSPGIWNEEPGPQKSPSMRSEQDVPDKGSKFPRSSSDDKEKLDSRESPVSNPRLFDETQVDGDVARPEDKCGPEESLFSRTVAEGTSESFNGKACYENKERADTNDVSLCKSASNQAQANPVKSYSKEPKDLNDRSHLLNVEDGDVTPSDDRDIINEREKLKETDEYRRATEEEWASRQRELRIQAEEAQRLRKRRKAESMLKYDIERRQKQRIEEVRETQKKDQENIDLKEQLRGEVRKEINKLEMTCIDMASLLRGLGILVRGGSQHDVHSAYKQALLKFHPDRASRTDIRQQVEAEEKFKLISRMKEKYLSTPCY
ncbi:DnaJ domain containing protein [Trema orientale]|uniref:DnaJ domain containing protein n=1 Tax=Trema orientale TaxID=63057 RepID=A0A2P5CTT9_TREOI|nr:DnaJ domain containing protein [Trema orientale]